MNSENDWKKALKQAAALKESAERNVSIAAIVAEALRSVNQEAVLVGGTAVEYYTQGGYSTADIDLVSRGGSDLIKVMENLGFEKIGKDFVHPSLKIYVEFPSLQLKPSEITHSIQVGKRLLQIVSPEDLLVDRLCAFKFWQSAIDGLNSLLLLENVELNSSRLEERAKEEKVWDALNLLQNLKQEIIRKKVPKYKANQMLESEMRRLKA